MGGTELESESPEPAPQRTAGIRKQVLRGIGWFLFLVLAVLGVMDLIARPRGPWDRPHWWLLGCVAVFAGACVGASRRWGGTSSGLWLRPVTLRILVLIVLLGAAYIGDRRDDQPRKELLRALQECSRQTADTLANGGDPGDRILHALAADAIFEVLPPGETGLGIETSPATYQDNCFEGGGWSGPSVRLCVQSQLSRVEAYRRTDVAARAAGWIADSSNSPARFSSGWRKAGPEPGVTLVATLQQAQCASAGTASFEMSGYGGLF